MADRTLTRFTEPYLASGKALRHSIEIERSARGVPSILISTQVAEMVDGEQVGEISEQTVSIPNADTFLRPVLEWLHPDETIELTPPMAEALRNAWWAEEARLRHTAEPWLSQADRDRDIRQRYVQEAIELGVPRGQVDRFVTKGHNDYTTSDTQGVKP